MGDRERRIAQMREASWRQDKVADEMRAKADEWELLERCHECGHQFTLTWTSVGHYGISGEGPESHADANYSSDPRTVTVRAHNLNDALRKAAALPLDAWFDEAASLSGDSGNGRVMSEDEALNLEDLGTVLEAVSPSSLAAHLDRDRPYNGQPHTDHGQRGATIVEGLTFRDVRDCFIRGCYEASGLPMEKWPGSVHDLPWNDIDIVAVAQNMSCWIERYMGIYPNVPPLEPASGDSGNPQ